MLGGILVFFATAFLAHLFVNYIQQRWRHLELSWLKGLFYYHSLLAFVYILYALFNASDSRYYYKKVAEFFRGPEWFDFYGTSTTFIEFVSYPFVHGLGFSYYAMMALFSFFGYLGFVIFYLFIKENIKEKVPFFGYDLTKIIFFLPNLHFWSSSLGKGPLIFFGIAIFFFSLNKIQTRIFLLFIAGTLIYHVRPHILLVILVSSLLGYTFSTKGVGVGIRILMLLVGSVAFAFIYQDVLQKVGIDETEVVSQGLDLSRRAYELSKATSGIDISQYNLAFKVFTFIYRPLFFDAPGILGLIVSLENVFYLLISIRLLTFGGFSFLFKSNAIVKAAFFSFLSASLALAQVSGNLGIAIRQKSQVMPLLLFVVIAYISTKNRKEFFSKIQKRKSDKIKASKP